MKRQPRPADAGATALPQADSNMAVALWLQIRSKLRRVSLIAVVAPIG